MDVEKVMELNKYLQNNAYDLNFIEFLSLIGTAIDEYSAKNGFDVNSVWEMLNTVRQQVFDELGSADYMNETT